MKQQSVIKRIAGRPLGCVVVLFILLAMADWTVAASLTESNDFYFVSPKLEVSIDAHAPGFDALDIDGLGLGKRGTNVLHEQISSDTNFVATISTIANGKKVDYRRAGQITNIPPTWSIEVNEHCLTFVSQWSVAGAPEPLSLKFDANRCHATVLGILNKNGAVRLPALMHLPGQGSMRITAPDAKDATLGYTSVRGGDITVAFPPATATTPRIEYRLDVTAIYPKLSGIADDHRFDSFRRNWLDVLQLNPGRRQLANNSGSTSCAFCYYEYGDIALKTPPLADGLTALDVMRQTLDSIFDGAKAYGLPAPGNFPSESSDTLPSLLIAADDCVRGGGCDEWLATNYTKIKSWADKMLATDTNHNGLVKYILSGNSGTWPPGFPKVRPANWWDTIGFGHEDAYGNALAYRALGCMAHMAQQLGKSKDAAHYRAAAKKLHAAYFKTFYDSATGVLGGWRSADGQLHDYYFLWVNGIAIDYGLVPRNKANTIMDKLMAKMKQVGYTNFYMGLPGNLVTVTLKDYVHRTPDGRFGGGVRPDNADGFQKYENGGATGCFAYFTLAALYDLGRRAEADSILFPMLEEYGRGGFEGRDAKGHSNDWRMWDGAAKGYEGFLSDNYYTMLAVLDREAIIKSNSDSAVQAMQPASAHQEKNLIGPDAFQIDTLPFLRTGVQTHQFCSYDRAGDNYDATYFPLYTDTNGECVIFDAMGPGCLYRQQMNIWYGDPIYKGIHIRYYFDGEIKPRIDMDVSTFFSIYNPLGIFQPPLAFDGFDPIKVRDRFRTFYHPMFFKKRLKVVLSAEPGGPGTVSEPWTGPIDKFPDRGSGHYHWYQYTYQLFAEDPGLDSWTPKIGRLMMPALIKAWNIKEEQALAIRGSTKKAVTSKINVGETAALWKTSKAGAITALHFQIAPTNNADVVFNSWLKITFDDAAQPQIDAPLGCFLGVYRNKLHVPYESLLLGWSNNQAYCYFPMPFWKSAVIQIENRGHINATVAVEIDYKKASASPYLRDRCGYLFASYHREAPRVEGRDYTYLETSNCSGQVVGRVVGRWNTCCEENERTYFDGSGTPWIEGDGYEDDQGMGWGLTWGPPPLTLPIFGAPTGNVGSGGLYRFLLPDMYCFSDGIKSGHQTYGPHSPAGEVGYYHQTGTEESVTFWYGKLQPRLIQTDELDVGNLQSEKAHDYHAEGDVVRTNGDWWYDGEYNNILFKTPPIADDGVSFTNSSTFTVAISPNNEGVRLRRRCDKENNRQKARVFIDGQLVTERPWYSVDYEKTYRGIRWLDSDFEVPAKYTKGKSKINVRIEFVSSETGRWDEYHYWIYSYRRAGKDSM